MHLAHAARLLAAARSLDALAPLVRACGIEAPPHPVARARLAALGIADVVTAARVAATGGPLRALLAELPPHLAPRDAARVIAARLARQTPLALWLLALVQHAPDGSSHVALAVWSADRRPPRVAALVVDPDHVVDSDAETLRALAAASHATGDADADALLRHARWRDLLGRDALGRRFYRALERAIAALADSARPLVPDAAARGDLALLWASRLLFLAFLEAKGWLDDDRAFLTRTFDACMTRGGEFHRRVLRPLAFGTLNTPPRRRAPAARAFGRVPFLNGGLFTPTALERRHPALRFDDASLGALVHDVLARHRFTAREDASTWSEAAVDPEMLGRAFETLMNAGERRATGAFYTPQPLVAHVTDAALVEALRVDARGAPLVAADAVRAALAGHALPPRDAARLHDRAAALRILDPACGSGAFLVHALERLADLRATCGDARPVADRRRDTLLRSIHGVDRNATAVWLCELRLWLSVVIDCDVDDPLRVPPLPNLDHHVRVGDALAPPFGTPLAAHARWGGDPWGAPNEKATVPARAPAVDAARARYARAAGARKHAAARRLDAVERAHAVATLDRLLAHARAARADLLSAARSRDLFGQRRPPPAAHRRRLDALRATVRTLAARRRALSLGGALPFGFAWHFAGAAAAGGFDAIVGNPPWVRPHALATADRVALRATYESARLAPWADGARAAHAGAGFAGQADLAAPFVERALALVRPGGAVALLVPAKLWRALAGGGLRALLAREARLVAVDDWTDAPPTFDAAVYPSLLVAVRRTPGAPREHECDVDVTVHRMHGETTTRVPAAALPLDGSPGSPWLLLPPPVRAAFDALRAAGPPLGTSAIARPTLGAKCGCNEAFLVRVVDVDGARARVRAGDREGWIERALLRPVLRGESLLRDDDDAEHIVWTHDASGRPLCALPPLAERWLAPWRGRLESRRDARGARAWWSLFRTAAADVTRPRVVWADLARTPRPRVLAAGDPHVPLNTCYVAPCADLTDARALAALLASPPLAAWLHVLAEPARGGYRRLLAWTVALMPVPPRWAEARDALAAIDRPSLATAAVLDAFGLDVRRVAPLVAWWRAAVPRESPRDVDGDACVADAPAALRLLRP